MLIQENINGLIFQEQRTYRIYKSVEDMLNGEFTFCTSNEKIFIENKILAKQKEVENNKDNKFIVL